MVAAEFFRSHRFPTSVRARLVGLAAAVCFGAVHSVQAQSPLLSSDSAAALSSSALVSLPDIVRDAELAGVRWPRITDVAPDLERAYVARNWAPLWLRDGRPTAAARAMIDALGRVDHRGLESRDYDVDRLQGMLRSGFASSGARADFEAVLSVASLRVVRALRSGRVPASDAAPRASRDSVSYAEALVALAAAPQPATMLDAMEPRFAQYRRLKEALASYRAQPEQDIEARSRANRIALSMERWRQLPQQAARTQIIVNIPAFQLSVMSTTASGTMRQLDMDVVVGSAFNSRTPAFSDSLQYLVFAPYWDVPASIARSELVPIGLRDPYLLKLNNYEVIGRRGRPVPMTLAAVRDVQRGKAHIRQLPGGTNALGRVKFMFPNQYDVYLHDSPMQNAFQKQRRDLSHGCIRVADPAALAALLLRDQTAWDSTAIAKAMNGKAAQRVNLRQAVPVHLLYATAVAHDDGSVTFLEDIYGQDAELAARIARGYPYSRAAVSVK